MFTSVESMLRAAQTGDKPLWEVILEDDMADRSVERESSWKKMTHLWQAMQAAEGEEGMEPPSPLVSVVFSSMTSH